MAEHSEHVLATYKRYHKYLEEIAKLEESRYIMSDTADDTLSIDQVIQTYQSRINDCSVILNWTANHLGLDVSEGVKFRIFI